MLVGNLKLADNSHVIGLERAAPRRLDSRELRDTGPGASDVERGPQHGSVKGGLAQSPKSLLPAVASPERALLFGPFRLCMAERRLERQGIIVPIGSRALDLLIALVQRAGEVVSKRDLTRSAWPDSVVEESSLRVHIAALRRALGDGSEGTRCIVNIAGRGYSFVASLREAGNLTAASPTPRTSGLPPLSNRTIGREETIHCLAAVLEKRQLVSIVGPGGMGKTTVAVAVGGLREASLRDGVCFVDLASVTDPTQIAATILSALGIQTRSSDPDECLTVSLADQHLLLILDTCDPVVAGVAALVEQLVLNCRELRILVTTRETLRAEGEHVHRLAPLKLPPVEIRTLREALQFPAVELFVETALAGGGRLEMADAEAPVICDICRKLEGLPLALQLAGGRVEAYGLAGIAALLNNRLRPALQGRRTALPRHKTLQALFDWSYNLLSQPERSVLRRLSLFRSPISIDAAQAIICDEEIRHDSLAEILSSLVAKSLAVPVVVRDEIHYRLLDTTREYAATRLAEEAETAVFASRHARYCLEFVQVQTAAGSPAHTPETIGLLAPQLGNLRAALAWCFSSHGDLVLGAQLATASEPLLLGLSLPQEARTWADAALAATAPRLEPSQDETEPQEILGLASMFTAGNSKSALAAIDRVLEIAEQLGDPDRNRAWVSRLPIAEARW